MQQFVIPIFTRRDDLRSWTGSGFLIDGWLVTAGHVLTRFQPYYALIDGHFVTLEPQLWSPTLLPANDKLEYDAAVYPLPTVTSPLSLATNDIGNHEDVDVLCWQRINGEVRQVATRGVTMGNADEDGYLLMATVDHITNGCSGCPIFRDGKVYGIVTMVRVNNEPLPPIPAGTPAHIKRMMEANTCWVFKASHIRRFLPQ